MYVYNQCVLCMYTLVVIPYTIHHITHTSPPPPPTTESWSFPTRPLSNLFTAATVPGVLDDATTGISPTTSGIPKTLSNMSNDDSVVTHEPLTPLHNVASGVGGPLARRRERFIGVQLDGSFATMATGRVLEDLLDALLEVETGRDKVGLGLLSMMGFDDTRELLAEAEVPMDKIDFIVCNAGADVWYVGGGRGCYVCGWLGCE